MTFQQLLYVVEISKCGSINKAAQKLYISQTGMSSAVRILEEELGVRFFTRSNHGVKFTPEGKRFVSYAVSLLEQKQRIESLYSDYHEEDAPLSFSVSAQRFTFLMDAFTQIVNTTKNNHIAFHYREANVDGVIDDVYDHRSDIGIIFLSDYTEKLITHLLKLRNLEFHEIATVAPSVYCRVGHPLTRLEKVTEEDLGAYPYIYYERGLGSAVEFSEEYQLISLRKPNKTICINSSMVCSILLSETDAFTVGSGLVNERMSKGILSLPLTGVDPMRIGWISVKNELLSPQAQEYVKLIQTSTEAAVRYTKGPL